MQTVDYITNGCPASREFSAERYAIRFARLMAMHGATGVTRYSGPSRDSDSRYDASRYKIIERHTRGAMAWFEFIGPARERPPLVTVASASKGA